MNNPVLMTLILLITSIGISQESKPPTIKKIKREGVEWCDIWIASAHKKDKPRVLIIGDSIAKGYYIPVARQLDEKAYCSRIVTSACVADPAFHVQLKAMFSQYKYSVIHLNNGLHGFAYSKKEYQEGYERVLAFLQKHSPSSKLVLALTTPLQSTSDKKSLNSNVSERNGIVRELAKKYGTAINDLHALSKDHPEFYKDPYHFKPTAIKLQADLVAKVIRSSLDGEKQNGPEN